MTYVGNSIIAIFTSRANIFTKLNGVPGLASMRDRVEMPLSEYLMTMDREGRIALLTLIDLYYGETGSFDGVERLITPMKSAK